MIAATQLPKIRHRLNPDQIIVGATIYQAFSLFVLAFVPTPWVIIPVLIGSGFCWTGTMSGINTSVQLSVPAWVTARALGTYLMTFQGGMALGSVTWGFVAEHFQTRYALSASAVGLLVTLPFVRKFKILQGPLPDFTPHAFLRPAPNLVGVASDEADPNEGPVRITVEYHIPLESYAMFTHAIHELRGVRLRDGAIRWGIYREASDPTRLYETFLMESWIDYLRSRERTTAADVAIRERAFALHQAEGQGDALPRVTHQIYAREIG